MNSKYRSKFAFTLVELMIVVAIIGILASIAIPAFIKYIRNSKNSEALSNIRNIYDSEVVYYTSDRVDRQGTKITPRFVSCPTTPATVPQGAKAAGNWDQIEWKQLNFIPDSLVNYSYSVDTGGTGLAASFTATANGDLDGDGILSTFERTANINATTGDVQQAAALYQSNNLE